MAQPAVHSRKKRQHRMKKTLPLILMSGVFYGLAYPPFDLHLLIFVSLAIFLHLIVSADSMRRVLARSYFVFFTASLVAISWISVSGMQENADRFLIIAGIAVLFVYPLFFLPAAGFTFFVYRSLEKKNLGALALAVFPFLWTAFEYLSTWGQITFPWLLAGNSQTYLNGKIQFIEYTGVYGLSFWISAASVPLCLAGRYILSGKSYSKSIPYFAAAVLIYFIPDLINPAGKAAYTETKHINTGVIQPNVNPWEKWGGKQRELIDEYAGMIREIHSKDSALQLIVLPETAFPFYFREFFFENSYMKIKRLCDSINVPLLIGTPDLEYYDSTESAPKDARIRKQTGAKYDTYNSAVLFEAGKDKTTYDIYHKVKLVPGSERMPYQEHVPFIKNLIEWGVGLGSWQIGRDTILFRLGDEEKFNAAICYESVFPGFFAEFVKRGAGFSVIITNDGWWGELAGTHQHSRYAVLRAVENRRWIVRCANTGISSFIDPYGKLHDETQINSMAMITKKIGYIEEKTFYSMHGDVFADACLWFSAFAVLLSFLAGIFSPNAPGGRP